MTVAEDGWEMGRAAFPSVSLPLAVFAAHVADRHRETGRAPTQWPDLYLACACGHGDPTALRAFEETFSSTVGATFRKLGLDEVTADEARQRLRERLFMGGNERRPKILAYSGTGALGSWLRSTAVRTALNHVDRPHREVPFEDEMLVLLVGSGPDAEFELLRRWHREALKSALRASFLSLEPRDRALMRYAFVERLSVDEIGVVFRIHRATAARWVVKAHETLIRRLRDQLGEPRDEAFDSALRLLRSQLDLSLERCFQATGS